jgi:hypothetical protein
MTSTSPLGQLSDGGEAAPVQRGRDDSPHRADPGGPANDVSRWALTTAGPVRPGSAMPTEPSPHRTAEITDG